MSGPSIDRVLFGCGDVPAVKLSETEWVSVGTDIKATLDRAEKKVTVALGTKSFDVPLPGEGHYDLLLPTDPAHFHEQRRTFGSSIRLRMPDYLYNLYGPGRYCQDVGRKVRGALQAVAGDDERLKRDLFSAILYTKPSDPKPLAHRVVEEMEDLKALLPSYYDLVTGPDVDRQRKEFRRLLQLAKQTGESPSDIVVRKRNRVYDQLAEDLDTLQPDALTTTPLEKQIRQWATKAGGPVLEISGQLAKDRQFVRYLEHLWPGDTLREFRKEGIHEIIVEKAAKQGLHPADLLREKIISAYAKVSTNVPVHDWKTLSPLALDGFTLPYVTMPMPTKPAEWEQASARLVKDLHATWKPSLVNYLPFHLVAIGDWSPSVARKLQGRLQKIIAREFGRSQSNCPIVPFVTTHAALKAAKGRRGEHPAGDRTARHNETYFVLVPDLGINLTDGSMERREERLLTISDALVQLAPARQHMTNGKRTQHEGGTIWE